MMNGQKLHVGTNGRKKKCMHNEQVVLMNENLLTQTAQKILTFCSPLQDQKI